jgi:hypothetical protein
LVECFCTAIHEATRGNQVILSRCCPGHVIGKIGYFAAIGFLAILLAGPVLGLLSVVLSIALAIFSVALSVFVVVLPFVIVGFVIMAPIEGALTGRPIQWSRLGDMCKGLWLKIWALAWWCCKKMIAFVHFLRRKLVALSIYVRVVFWEVVCGALVGAFLGAVAVRDLDKPDFLIGALIGAVLGAIVGTSRLNIREPALGSSVESAQS